MHINGPLGRYIEPIYLFTNVLTVREQTRLARERKSCARTQLLCANKVTKQNSTKYCLLWGNHACNISRLPIGHRRKRGRRASAIKLKGWVARHAGAGRRSRPCYSTGTTDATPIDHSAGYILSSMASGNSNYHQWRLLMRTEVRRLKITAQCSIYMPKTVYFNFFVCIYAN